MSVPGPSPPDGVLTGPPDCLRAGEPMPGLSDTSPDEGLVEDLTVEDKAVEQLAEGLLSHYLPDLQRSKQALQELTASLDAQAGLSFLFVVVSFKLAVQCCCSKTYPLKTYLKRLYEGKRRVRINNCVHFINISK
ncbi:hypothetical protein HPG69_001905 [Diceros bicornis minor]|uniref:Biogenesis of lysosome-related organelles complex 1 subunit 6 n=1 Tax=Diceros bicornis minor TaxID=77932 RepID=A0A7J7FBP9_DICBM|nr:hypothetical protein HPG69_001905 [Diceros bicornis minor]